MGSAHPLHWRVKSTLLAACPAHNVGPTYVSPIVFTTISPCSSHFCNCCFWIPISGSCPLFFRWGSMSLGVWVYCLHDPPTSFLSEFQTNLLNWVLDFLSKIKIFHPPMKKYGQHYIKRQSLPFWVLGQKKPGLPMCRALTLSPCSAPRIISMYPLQISDFQKGN